MSQDQPVTSREKRLAECFEDIEIEMLDMTEMAAVLEKIVEHHRRQTASVKEVWPQHSCSIDQIDKSLRLIEFVVRQNKVMAEKFKAEYYENLEAD